MPVNQNQLDLIIERMSLTPGDKLALKQAFALMLTAPVIVWEDAPGLTGSLVATGTGGLTITPEGNPGEVVFGI